MKSLPQQLPFRMTAVSNGTANRFPICDQVLARLVRSVSVLTLVVLAGCAIAQATAPSNLVYPQTSISVVVGQSIVPDVPSYSGSAATFTVSPALPAGLGINPSTGAIVGAPSGALALATYTVTAKNSSGSTTAAIKIAVTATAATKLAYMGATGAYGLRQTTDRVLSFDQHGHWVLWNYATAALLGEGDSIANASGFPVNPNYIDLKGSYFGVAIPNALEIHSTVDGHRMALIIYPGLEVNAAVWWQLASDGSYAVIGSSAGINTYETFNGLSMGTAVGDFSKAVTYAAPSQLMVLDGPAGQNKYESIYPVNGSVQGVYPILGTFKAWFLDGSHFITNESGTNNVWVYSSTSALQASVSLPYASVATMSGQGNWLYSEDPSGLNVYTIGSDTPSFNTSIVNALGVFFSQNAIAVLPYGSPQVTVVDVSGATPTKTVYNLPSPIVYLQDFASVSASQWVVGNQSGAVLDGSSLATTPRYFGQGKALSIAGGTGNVSVATSIGKILAYDPSGPTLLKIINFYSYKLLSSSSGSVLGAAAVNFNAQYGSPDRSLKFYSLPSGSTITTFAYSTTTTNLKDFTLSGDGGTIGRLTSNGTLARTVTGISGSPVDWSDTSASSSNGLQLSPDGTLVAAGYGYPSSSTNPSTNIYKNGTLQAIIQGLPVGWLDNGRLLVNQYASGHFSAAAIFGPNGTKLSSTTLPALSSIQPIPSNSDEVYYAAKNTIYSVSTGHVVWTGSLPSTGLGAVSGSYVVYGTGHLIVREPF